MKIENFDTGLKGQEDVENIIITPEENYRNKQKVKNYLIIEKIMIFCFQMESQLELF